jgi:hypothetical protein
MGARGRRDGGGGGGQGEALHSNQSDSSATEPACLYTGPQQTSST